ncbi:MAG: Holliday junction resolvase RuvX [Dehalococcoidia bacterium]|nr:Holliday junction resolvase RuvX [Dehalococcoidia bacterium]
MRFLGVDAGEARVGLAVSDPEGRYAIPLEVLPASAAFPAIRAVVAREGIAVIVVGLARLPSGDEGDAARMARRLGERLRRTLDVPVEYEDETLTSQAAEQAVGRGRASDDVAASIILQQYLDRRSTPAGGPAPHDDA